MEPRDTRDLALMQTPERWPLRVMLALCHRTRVDGDHYPVTGILAEGHRTTVFYANVGDFSRDDLRTRDAFNAALKRFDSVPYLSFEAIAKDWRVD